MSSAPLSCPNCSAPLRATDQACPFCRHVVDAGAPPSVQAPVTPPPPHAPEAPPDAPTWQAAEPVAVDVDSAATEPVPWENWRELGFFASLWRTWRDAVFSPVPFFRRMPPRGGIGPALGYAVLLYFVVFGPPSLLGALFLWWESVHRDQVRSVALRGEA